MVIVMLLILPVCLLGKSLPTWMFLNTLMLVAHLPLLNTAMPANLHQFLKKYLDLVRLNIDSLPFDLDDSYDISRLYQFTKAGDNQLYGENNRLLQACGYGSLFINNTVVLSSLFALIILAWLLVAIKDYCFSCFRHRLPKLLRPGHEEFMSNITLRFLY